MLNVNLNGNGSGFEQMLKRAEVQGKAFANSVSHEIGKSWEEVGKSLKSAFAAIFTFEGIKGAFEAVTGKVEELHQLSEQLGTEDVEKIQKWGKAFEKVGGNISKLTTLTAQMTEKRNAAMGHDMSAVKARQELEGMGFTKDEINPENGMNSLDFMQKAFHFSNQGESNRNYFESVFGAKSARFAGAEKYLSKVQPGMSQETFDTMKETAESLHQFEDAVKKATGSLLAIITWSTGKDKLRESIENAQSPDSAEARLNKSINSVREKVQKGTATEFEEDWLARVMGGKAISNGKPLSGRVYQEIYKHAGFEPKDNFKPGNKTSEPTEDEDEKALREQREKEEADARLGLNASARGNMTIGDRRANIASDIGAVDKQIGIIQGKLKSSTLGLSKESFDKLTGVEKDDLKHKLTMDLIGEQTKKNSLTADLKEKPLSFNSDSLAKSGLYSASALSFNPVLGIAQQQLTELRKISINTAPKQGATTPKRDSFGDIHGGHH